MIYKISQLRQRSCWGGYGGSPYVEEAKFVFIYANAVREG